MIDFISVELEKRIINSVLINPLLNFAVKVNEETGEYNPHNKEYLIKTAYYEGFKFCYTKNLLSGNERIHLKGSIHKYYTGGVNHTDFDLDRLKWSLNALKVCFDIELNKSFIHTLEFGVNIKTPISCSEILSNILFYLNRKPVELDYSGKGQLIEFRLSQYRVKIYNKSLQYFTNGIEKQNQDNLMRIEIHVDTMQYLQNKSISIRTLEDLTNIKQINKMGNLLTNMFKDIVLFDVRIKTTGLSLKEKRFLIELNNPRKWDEIRKDKRAKYYSRQLEKFREITIQNTPNNLQLTISKIIQNKWDSLTKNVPILPLTENTKMSVYYPYIVCNKETLNKRYCIVTGIDITEQKTDSKFLAETTIDKILMRNKTLYYELLKKYGTKKETENVNYHIAHNIRNSHFNDSNNFKRKLEKSINQTTLFNPKEVLTLSEGQKELINRFTELQTIIQ